MTTIGRVDFVVGLDGTVLPARARQIGRQVGRELSRGIDAELTARFRQLGANLSRSMDAIGARAGDRLGGSFATALERRLGAGLSQSVDRLGTSLSRIGGSFRDADFGGAADDLGELIVVVRESDSSLQQLAITAGDTDQRAGRLGETFRQIGDDAERSNSRLSDLVERFRDFNVRIRETVAQGGGARGFFRELTVGMGENERQTDSLIRKWKDIPHGARQFIFYTALFANLADSIAVLGSAAGAGLLTLGAAATAGGIGLTALVVAFTGLGGELDDLPAEIRPAVSALRGLGDEFGELRKQLQIRTLQNLAPAFESLRNTVRGLTPDFAALGDVTAGLITDLAENLKPGTTNFQRLQSLIRSSGPIFDRLVRNIGRFGEGLLAAFSNPAMTRSVNGLIDWLDKLADGFTSFAESDQLAVWLGRAEIIFGRFGSLLDATGQMLNNLVDAEAVGRLAGFMSNIEGFMPSLETILSVLGEFDIFGLLAQGLNDFGAALAPLGPPMEDLATALNDIVQAGIDRLAPIFGDIAEALAPLVQEVADFLAANPQAVADALLAIAGGALALKGAQGLAGLGAVVTTNLGALGTAVKDDDWKSIGSKMGKGGAAAFLPALIAGLFSGEGGAGVTIATATVAGLSVGGLPGAIAGALIGAIVSMFTDPESWSHGAEQIAAFFSGGLGGILNPESWSGGWEQIKEFNRIASDEIATQFETSWTEWGGKFEHGRDQINQGVGTWWEQLMGAFANGGTQLGAAWDGAWQAISAKGAEIWGIIAGGVGAWWGSLMAAFANGASQIAAGWDGFWSGLSGIVGGVWSTIVGIVTGGVNAVVGAINWMIARVNAAISTLESLSGGLINLPNIPNLPRMASGGILYGPTRIMAGEAGREAIVPLDRPLSQVDPAVRGIAAYAQGKDYGQSPVQGDSVTIAEGAITVVEAGNAQQTAAAVMDRFTLGVLNAQG